MIVGLSMSKFINNNIASNISTCISLIKKAKENSVDLILFGEAFLQGFEALEWVAEKDLLLGIERQSNKLNMLRKYCRKMDIALGIGYIEREGSTLFSSYLVINKKGNDLINYRRISKGWRLEKSDNNVYMEGTTFYVFDFMDHKITAGLCGDFWIDEVIYKLPKDIDTVLWPAFVRYDKNEWTVEEFKNYIEQSKKICKNIFFVNSICEGKESFAYCNSFAIINGKLKASMEQGKEDLLIINYA
jgi:predicted amidohydrolase